WSIRPTPFLPGASAITSSQLSWPATSWSWSSIATPPPIRRRRLNESLACDYRRAAADRPGSGDGSLQVGRLRLAVPAATGGGRVDGRSAGDGPVRRKRAGAGRDARAGQPAALRPHPGGFHLGHLRGGGGRR